MSASSTAIFARARPEKVEIEETYHFVQELARTRSTTLGPESPTGRIRVTTPYDGRSFFTRVAMDDVQHQLDGSADRPAEALFGHLSFDHLEETNLGEVLTREGQSSSLPLELPVRGPEITSLEDLGNDRLAAVSELRYVPSVPEIAPVKAILHLMDEDELTAPSNEKILGRREDFANQVTTFLKKSAKLRRRLVLFVQIHVQLPEALLRDATPDVELTELALKWPTIPYPEATQMSLPTSDWAPEMRYDVRKGAWVWGGVKLVQAAAGGGRSNGFVEYWTEVMMLTIDQPGELSLAPILEGTAVVEVRGLLHSGLRAQLFNATGARSSEPEIDFVSRINLDLQLILDDALRSRLRSPVQHLHFDQVIPEEMRLHDIRAALDDQGLRIEDDGDKGREWNGEMRQMIAKRTVGGEELRLYIFLRGRKFDAERKTELAGGRTFTTDVESGQIEVFLRGELKGQATPVIEEMNALHERLRRQFMRMADHR